MARYILRRFDSIESYRNHSVSNAFDLTFSREKWIYSVLTVGYGPLLWLDKNVLQAVMPPCEKCKDWREWKALCAQISSPPRDCWYVADAILQARSGVTDFSKSVLWGLGRAYQGLAVFDFQSDLLSLSPFFGSLDRSEKAEMSYTLAMGLTNLVAKEHFHIPWLLHLDRFYHRGWVEFIKESGKTGDLVGIDDDNRWHIVEVKGRSTSTNWTSLAAGAAEQVRGALIMGFPPIMDVSIVRLGDSPIKSDWIDPDLIEQRNYWISKESFFWNYYHKWWKLYEASRTAGVKTETMRVGKEWLTFKVFTIGEDTQPKIRIGVAQEIVNSWRYGEPWSYEALSALAKSAFSVANRIKTISEIERKKEIGVVGPDGIAIFRKCT